MSAEAPWIALAVDWDESEMWDPLPQYGIADESTHGERLAWVCLLCDVKRNGRGGKATIRKSQFQKRHRLSERAVDGMFARAQKCGAIKVDGESVTLCNWGTYQEKKGGKKPFKPPEIQRSAVPPTTNQPPITHHQPPPPTTKPDGWAEAEAVLFGFGVALAAEAIASARASGCTVNQVRNAMEFWRARQPAWKPGALYERLMRLKPDQNFDSLWPPGAESNGYRQISASEFAEHVQMKRFKDRPQRHASEANWVFGTLRDGSKVECRSFPPTKKEPA